MILTVGRYAGGDFQPEKFESNRGIDPFSYGFNHLTKDEDYMTGEEIVVDIVDIVANNGNYLLNIGPRQDGSIPEAQRRNLLDAGEWIHAHEDAIFGTRYWSVARHSGQFRFMTKPDAFFIHHVGEPAAQLTVGEPVPWMKGDVVTIVGGTQDGAVVDASRNEDGDFVMNLSEDAIKGDKYVWTFKITYATE